MVLTMKQNLEISDAERLILANQYEILARLDRLQSGHEHDSYSLLASQLRDGYEWLYQQSLSYMADVLDERVVNHVLETLELFSTLKASYDRLADKSGIDEHHVTFLGFDGNNEAEMLGFAHALGQADRYNSVLDEGNCPNSHMPTYELYGRMIEQWKALGSPRFPLTKDHIQQIAAARIHPENRT